MKWILILSMFVSCNALKTLTDGETKVPSEFNSGICPGNYCQDSLYNSLLAFYHFDGPSLGDDKTGQNHLTVTGTPATASGKTGLGLDCLATNTTNFLAIQSLNSQFSLGTNQDITISFWTLTSTLAVGTIVFFKNSSNHTVYFLSNASQLLFHATQTTSITYNSSAVVNDVWEHWVLRVIRNSKIEFFKNGIIDGSASNTVTTDKDFNFVKLAICGDEFGTPPGSALTVDNIGIWGRALSNNEISNLYNGNTDLN